MNVFVSNTFSNDAMQVSSWQEVATRIAGTEFRDEIEQLRKIKRLDTYTFQQMKRKLPWFCPAHFTGNIRKTENFLSLSYLMLDIDTVEGTTENLNRVFARICSDARTFLAFRSPSGTGIKVIIRLSTQFTDVRKFADFYRTFASNYPQSVGGGFVCDLQTCDVTRVCFFSSDSDAYFNPSALEISIPEKEVESNLFAQKLEVEPGSKKDIADPAMSRIKELLLQNPYRAKPQNEPIVPSELYVLPEVVHAMCKRDGIGFEEPRPIQYGLKFRIFLTPVIFAEANVFYGKKGFTVVAQPIRNANPQLAEVLTNILYRAIGEVSGWYVPLQSTLAANVEQQ